MSENDANPRELVALFEAAQAKPSFAWTKRPSGVELAEVDGVVFVPSHIERSHAETKNTPSSRMAMFFLPLSLSAFYGAYSIWGEHPPYPTLLLAGGFASLGIGIAAARRSQRNDAARSPRYVFRKGLYLAKSGALVVQGLDDDDFSFHPRATIVGAEYVLSGRTRRTKLSLRDGGSVFAHALDVRPVIEEWLARGSA